MAVAACATVGMEWLPLAGRLYAATIATGSKSSSECRSCVIAMEILLRVTKQDPEAQSPVLKVCNLGCCIPVMYSDGSMNGAKLNRVPDGVGLLHAKQAEVASKAHFGFWCLSSNVAH